MSTKSPLFIHMYLTPICNLRCTHCYYDAKVIGDDPGPLLSVEHAANIISVLCERFDADFHVEGGEVFLRDDLGELLSRLSVAELRSLTLTTSGTVDLKIGRPILKQLGELRISVEGHTDALQRKIRGVSLARVLRTIDSLVSEDVPFTLRLTLYRDNIRLLDEMIETYAAHGIRRFSFFEFQAAGRGANGSDEFELSEPEIEDVVSRLSKEPLLGEVQSLKLSLSPKRAFLADRYASDLTRRGVKIVKLGSIPNLTINSNGDLGVSPWLATAHVIKDRFANYHEIAFASVIAAKMERGELMANCGHTSEVLLKYDASSGQ